MLVRWKPNRFTCNSKGVTDVRFGSKADMCGAKRHVRFTPNSDIDCVFWHVCVGPEADMKPLRLFNYIGNSIARRYEHDLILSDEEFECFNLRDFLDHH